MIQEPFTIRFQKAIGFKNWWKRRRFNKKGKLLAYAVYCACKKNVSLQEFMDLMFYVQKKGEERGYNVGVPYYLYINGAVVSWPDLRDKVFEAGYSMLILDKNGREIPAEIFQEYAESVGK
jgi:hypothetical protein